MSVDDETLLVEIERVLSTQDLSAVSVNQMTLALEKKFHCDLSERKLFIKCKLADFVDKMVEEAASSLNESANVDEDGGEEEMFPEMDDIPEEMVDIFSEDIAVPLKKAKLRSSEPRRGGFCAEVYLAGPLQTLLGTDKMPRTQVTKLVWAYIKEHALQNPSDRREILCDNKLQAVFQRPKINMFKMTKALSKMMTDASRSHEYTVASGGEHKYKKDVKDKRESAGNSVKTSRTSCSSSLDANHMSDAKKNAKTKRKAEKDGEDGEGSTTTGNKKKLKKESPASVLEVIKSKKGIKTAAKLTAKDKASKRKQSKKTALPSVADVAGMIKAPKAFKKSPLSPAMADLLGVREESRPQVVKRLWSYIREKGLQNPENKQVVVLDEAMIKVFGVETFTIFSMNKLLSAHILPTTSS